MIFRLVTLVVSAALGGALGLWTIDRDPPVVINQAEVLTPEVPPGGTLRIKYHLNRRRDCESHIDRILYDSAKVRGLLPDIDFAKTPGQLGNDEYTAEIRIPETFSEGQAVYRLISVYRCNVIHKAWPITIGPTDIPFAVKGMPLMTVPVPMEYR
jgi:hypothetical protein